MDKRLKLVSVGAMLLIIAIGMLLYRSFESPIDQIANGDAIINESPIGSFYFYKDEMPCVGFVFEHKPNSADVDVSITCDWSQWGFQSETLKDTP